ncbi:MAG: hypothetical protein V1857_06915 [archaeon]
MAIEDLDFNFENRKVRIVFVRDCGAFSAVEKSWGPFSEGQETELPHWIAEELINIRVAKPREEDRIDLAALSKAHWRETLPSSRQIPALESDFFPKLRRFLTELKVQSRSDPTKGRDYEKAVSLSKDIVNCRVRKLVSLSAAPPTTQEVITSMTAEERVLYENLNQVLEEWRKRILGPEGE